MRRKLALIGLLYGFSCAAAPLARAGAGEDGAAFLQIPVGARAAALGGAYDALSNDAYAPAWNPAGLGMLPGASVSATYLGMPDSVSYSTLMGAVPIRRGDKSYGGFGASFQYLSPGSVSATDAAGSSIGKFNGHYGVLDLAYGLDIGHRLALGIGAKVLSAEIAGTSAQAGAADLGAMYKLGERVTLAFVAANLGSSLKFDQTGDSLPRQYRFGGALQLLPSLDVAAQGVFQDSGGGANLGTEWRPLPVLALRAGFQSQAMNNLGGPAGLTLGVGFRLGGLLFDYAWMPLGDLGMSNYVSLGWAFGPAPGGTSK